MHYMANMFTFVHVHNVANGLTYGPKSASNLTDEIQTLLLPLADNKEGFIHSFSVHLARQITSDRLYKDEVIKFRTCVNYVHDSSYYTEY